jgi:hypothetical protein
MFKKMLATRKKHKENQRLKLLQQDALETEDYHHRLLVILKQAQEESERKLEESRKRFRTSLLEDITRIAEEGDYGHVDIEFDRPEKDDNNVLHMASYASIS